MNLRKLIEPLLNERGQVGSLAGLPISGTLGSLSGVFGPAGLFAGPLLSQLFGGSFGLMGDSPRGATEFSSMQRREARQAGVDEGQARGLKTALLQRAGQAAFGIRPIDEQIKTLREAFNTASGKNRRIISDSIYQLEAEKAAGGGEHMTQDFTQEQLGPFHTRLLPSEREMIESQFKNAQNQVIGGTGQRGGQLSKSLADLSIERARAVSGANIDATQRGQNLALSLLSGTSAPSAVPEVGNVLRDIRGQEAGTAQGLMAGGQGIGALIQQLMKDRNPKPQMVINQGNPETPSTTGLLAPEGLFTNNEALKKMLGLKRPNSLWA